ncbi:MAG: hypothetical protein Q8S55_05925 [Methylococcaceae bacterium]|nr:hypothetical protein [Methylococcaceae bacterium]
MVRGAYPTLENNLPETPDAASRSQLMRFTAFSTSYAMSPNLKKQTYLIYFEIPE